MKRIGIIAALPGELQPLVRGWRRERTLSRGVRKWRSQHGETELVAVCAGMGGAAATRALAEAEREGPVDLVLSIGWAGACEGGMTPGHVSIPSVVIDARTGEQFDLTAGKRKLRLVSTAGVANPSEKERLRKSYGAVMVDMESAAIVRMALARNIPVLCMKAISDGRGESLPDFNRFIDQEGHLRLASFVVWSVLRPGYWPVMLRLRKYSAIGAKQLGADVMRFLETMDVDGVNRRGYV